MKTHSSAPEASSARERITVIHLAHEYPPEEFGGLATYVAELSDGLARRGHHVYVLAPTTGEARVQRDGSIEIHWVPLRAIQSYYRPSSDAGGDSSAGANFRQAMIECGQRLLRMPAPGPVILHSHDWFTFQAAMALRREFGHPVFNTVNGIQETRRWWGEPPVPAIVAQEREMYAQADGIIAVSHSIRTWLESRYQVDPARIAMVHSGIHLDPFLETSLSPAQQERLRERVAPDRQRMILFAGRVELQKGIAPLLESAALLVRQRRDVRYVFAGETNSTVADDLLKNFFAANPDIQAHIKLLGKIPRKQLALLYQIADIAVMPSLYEPFGFVAVEAMAAGVPVVASAIGGFAEIIEHDVTGLLVPVSRIDDGPTVIDPAALAEAQQRLLQDAALAARLSAAARARVQTAFSIDQMTEGTLAFYWDVLRRHAESAA